MNKKISLGAAVAFMLVIAAATFSVTMVISLNYFNTMVYNVKEREKMYLKLSEVDHQVRQNYNGTIDEQALQDSISKGFVAGLDDPYSAYLTKEEFQEKKESNTGTLVGIGVTVQADDTGYIRVIDVNADSPAELAGVKPNDLIIQVDDTPVTKANSTHVDKLIKGKVGTKVNLTIRRENKDQMVEIIRQKIDHASVEYQMLGTTGYIRVTEFKSNTVAQFSNAVDDLLAQDAKSLIFDMRNNGGGLVDACCKMLDKLVPEGDLVTAEYKNGTKEVIGRSGADEVNLPMAVLINSHTASAAELFTANLRDYNKAVTVGVTTFGKGVMQILLPLEDGSAVNVTNARIYPYGGESFHKVGIAPMYEVKLTKEQEEAIGTGDPSSDLQVAKALEVVNSAVH